MLANQCHSCSFTYEIGKGPRASTAIETSVPHTRKESRAHCRLYRTQIDTKNLRARIFVANCYNLALSCARITHQVPTINGPYPRSSANINDILWVVQRCIMQLPTTKVNHHSMFHIFSLLFALIVGKVVSPFSEFMISSAMFECVVPHRGRY
jgi:hypothetical protein